MPRLFYGLETFTSGVRNWNRRGTNSYNKSNMMQFPEQKSVFDSWLSTYKGVLFKVVRAYAFNLHDQEDLFQEIATQLWSSVPSFEGNSAPSTWIYRVALNTAISWSRKELRRHDKIKEAFDGDEPALCPNESEKDPRLEWLYEQIRQLNELDRSLTLLLLDGFSYKEMADALGISETNVGVRIHRIKAHLTTQSAKET
jgi:RNA polymerase sigma-70 factor (ECF subfamily)